MKLPVSDDNIPGAACQIIDMITSPTGHRFWHQGSSYLKYYYYKCCQDKQNSSTRRKIKDHQRDREQMDWYDCQSSLNLVFYLAERTLKLQFVHNLHKCYEDIKLSPEILNFISSKLLDHTPAEIFNEVRSQRIKGWNNAAEHQIYYQWQIANAGAWRRDSNPVKSAYCLLGEMKEYNTAILESETLLVLLFSFQPLSKSSLQLQESL